MLGAPEWHGHNFDAVIDSIGCCGINAVDVPYQINIHQGQSTSPAVQEFLGKFAKIISFLNSNGCPVDLAME